MRGSRSNLRMAMVLTAVCAALVLGITGMGTAVEGGTPGGRLDGCELYLAFSSINGAWRDGRITDRELVLRKAKAYYEERSGFDNTCNEEVLDHLKRELLEDVYRLADELRKSDRVYLQSLDMEVAEALDRGTGSPQKSETQSSDEIGSASDRIAEALNEGRITLKQAVLLRAKLRYAPQLVPARSEFAAAPGEGIEEECGTGFYKDLHRVRRLLSAEDRALLRSLSPDLDIILKPAYEQPLTSLPNYPQLNRKYRGNTCIVHYTLAGTHAVPNKSYPAWVASLMDQAIGAETKAGHFRAAYAEGGGRLHVYCLNMGSTNGEWVDVSDVPGTGKRKSGYIKISSTITSRFGASWKTKLAGVTTHEYFHGVQSAYNYISDLWFMEATSVWASCYYGGDYEHVGDYYKSAQSVFNKPNENIWVNTYRKYSTSTLAFHLAGKYAGHKIIRTYFRNSETQDDAIELLKTTLAVQTGAPAFGDVFKEFLLRLYAKKISGIKSYMPNVKLESTHKNYGVPLTDGNVALLGANFYRLATPTNATLREAPLIATLEKGAVGNPQGVLAAKGEISPAPIQDGRSYLPTAIEAVFIATDVDYTTKDATTRPYKYTAITPHVKIKQVTADSPITSGSYSNIHVLYNLRGTVAGQTFRSTLKVIEKGPDVTDNASGDLDLSAGTNGDLHLYFTTSSTTQGTYRFTFQLRVPVDSWNIPQVKSNGTCVVVVKPPASASVRSGMDKDRGGIIEIRR